MLDKFAIYIDLSNIFRGNIMCSTVEPDKNIICKAIVTMSFNI